MRFSKMFDYKYLSPADLKGLNNYKYSAIDTSPLSNHLMHPAWNTFVKFIPKWVAPNLLTFAGFLCMVVGVLLLSVYDYDCSASGRPPGYQESGSGMPNWVLTTCGVLLFLAYNLDGIDGKQARRIGVSGPLGEMFDHGLDSYIVFLIPFSLFSVFGRDEYSLSTFRGFIMVVSVVLNFYVSHCEKYNTGTLYLPWGYDVSMWGATLLLIIAGLLGPSVYKFHLFGRWTFVQAVEVIVHGTGLLTTLPIAVYNVYLSYKDGTGKMYSLLEAIRPVWSMLTMTAVILVWAVKSPNDVIEYDPRAFMLIYGTLFSNIASRLIVAEMSGQRCELNCWMTWPLLSGVVVSLFLPRLELAVLYTFLPLSLIAHIHYGVCVVRQICQHFDTSCFTVRRQRKIAPKVKRK